MNEDPGYEQTPGLQWPPAADQRRTGDPAQTVANVNILNRIQTSSRLVDQAASSFAPGAAFFSTVAAVRSDVSG